MKLKRQKFQKFTDLVNKAKLPLSTALLTISFSVTSALIWTIWQFRINSLHSNVSWEPWEWVKTIWLYPWTDMLENIIVGFNIANGLRFGHETIVVHMPGIPQYLALFFKIFGIADETPSIKLIPLTIAVSAFAITLFEISCTYAALRIIGILRGWALLISATFQIFISLIYSAHLPMSENVIPFILLVQFACLHEIMNSSQKLAYRLKLASWSLSFLPFVNLMAGLTIAPSVIFLCGFVAFCTFLFVKREWKNFCALPKTTILVPIALTAFLIILEIVNLDLKALWFWNFEVNKNSFDSNLLRSVLTIIAESFCKEFTANWNLPKIFGGRIYELLIAVAFYLFSKHFGNFLKKDKNISLILISCVIAILGMWRSNSRPDVYFKAGAIAGITWCFIVIGVSYLCPRLKNKDLSFGAVKTTFFGSILLSTSFYLIYLFSIFYKKIETKRHEAFEMANVCHFRSQTKCRCLQITAFSPQTYLEHDVRQCADRYSSFAMVLFRNDLLRQNLINDVKSDEVAFLVFPKNMLEIDDVNKDSRIIDAFYGGGLKCIQYTGDAKICYKSAKK